MSTPRKTNHEANGSLHASYRAGLVAIARRVVTQFSFFIAGGQKLKSKTVTANHAPSDGFDFVDPGNTVPVAPPGGMKARE